MATWIWEHATFDFKSSQKREHATINQSTAQQENMQNQLMQLKKWEHTTSSDGSSNVRACSDQLHCNSKTRACNNKMHISLKTRACTIPHGNSKTLACNDQPHATSKMRACTNQAHGSSKTRPCNNLQNTEWSTG